MGREVGAGIGMGKTCEPKAFSFQCMTKFTTNKKKKKKEIKKKIELPYDTAIPLLGISEENTNSKKFLHLYVPCSITYNSQYMEAVCTHQ